MTDRETVDRSIQACMKLCAIQTRPFKGDIARNLTAHKQLLALAPPDTDLALFPELSLTGYEPALAGKCSIALDDNRLEDFQQISDSRNLVIGVGAPVKKDHGIVIGLILFRPQKPRQLYSKKYLHADEEPFFASGENFTGLTLHNTPIALAICYELSVEEHTKEAFRNGASVYCASAVKSVRTIGKSLERLATIARNHHATVLFTNSVGQSDGEINAGRSSAWNARGELIAQLDDQNEGLLLVDTGSGRAAVIR